MPQDTTESGYPQTTEEVDAGLMGMLGNDPELPPDETNQSDLSQNELPSGDDNAPAAPLPGDAGSDEELLTPDEEDEDSNSEDSLLDELPDGLGEEAEESESEDEDSEADEPPHSATDAGYVKQIKKLRKQRQDATAALEKLEAEHTRLQQQLDQLTALNPKPSEDLGEFTGVKDEADFQQRMTQLRKAKRWLRSNPDGGDYGENFIEGDRVAGLLDSVEEALEVQAPAAREWLSQQRESEARSAQARAHYDAQCEQMFPWILDEDSADYQTLEKAYQAVPVLKQLPQGRFWAALAVEGAKVMKARGQARQAKAKAKSSSRKKSPAPPKPAAAPQRLSRGDGSAQQSEASARFEKDPTNQNLESVLAGMLNG